MTDQLVECVVTPDIFAQEFQFAVRIKKRAGMQPAGALKGFLGRDQLLRERVQQFSGNRRRRADRRKLLLHRVDGCFPANATTGGSEKMPAEFRPVELCGITKREVDHVFGRFTSR